MMRILVFPIVSVLLLVGCVAEDPGTLVVVGAQAVTRAQQCQPKVQSGGSSNQAMVSMGVLDLLQANTYVFFPMVKNFLPSSLEASGKEIGNMAAETNDITITGAWLSYEMSGLEGPFFGEDGLDLDEDGEADLPGDISLPSKFFVQTSGYVGVAGQTVVALEAVPAPVGLALDVDKAFDQRYSAGIMNVKVVLTGLLGDGTEVHGTPFNFPIKVCRGCLVYYDMKPEECCLFNAQPANAPCFPGQDEASTCTTACHVAQGAIREDAKIQMVLGLTDTLAEEVK